MKFVSLTVHIDTTALQFVSDATTVWPHCQRWCIQPLSDCSCQLNKPGVSNFVCFSLTKESRPLGRFAWDALAKKDQSGRYSNGVDTLSPSEF